MPFMKRTTGAELTALSIAERVVSLRYLAAGFEGMNWRWSENWKGCWRRVRRSCRLCLVWVRGEGWGTHRCSGLS